MSLTRMQREAISALTDVWSMSPDVRLGQLLSHLDFLCDDQLDKGMAYADDDELVAVIYRHRAELLARLAD
jgi:hypothetical protein